MQLMKIVNEEVWMSLKYRGVALSSPEMPLSQMGTPPMSRRGPRGNIDAIMDFLLQTQICMWRYIPLHPAKFEHGFQHERCLS
jgi:hypothetical protein